MSTLLLFLTTFNIHIQLIQSQCLSNPQAIRHNATGNDIEWREISQNVYAETFVFDVSQQIWPDLSINAQITTRLFNNSFPSQTLRFKRGNQYQITIVNNLGPESIYNPTGHNVPKDPNTTNIHTHGLHLTGQNPGDSVFVRIDPGQSHTYIYNIPCDHSGGTFWWHPHHHGSVHLQVAGGASGALIIEDDQISEGLPDWYVNMEELIFFITHLHLMKYGSMVNYTWDYPWSYERVDDTRPPGSIDTFFVNGEYQPTVCMTSGEWIKFKFIQIETTEHSRTYYIGDGECTQYLLSRDGVMVHGINDTDIPRIVGNAIFLTQSSRADVAISCPGDPSGSITYDIWTNNTGVKQIIAFIAVTGTITTPQTELTSFIPIRPSYLENLLDGYYSDNSVVQLYPDPDNNGQFLNYWKNMLVTGASIGNQHFIDETSYLQEIEINTINTWEVTNQGNHLHPFHIHINHFQVLNSTLSDLVSTDYGNWVEIPYGYQETGDWIDTIWGPGWIRFKPHLWAGTVAMHCHILIHEDQGAMGTFKIINGCDAEYNDYNGDNACNYTDICQQFVIGTTTSEPSTTLQTISTSQAMSTSQKMSTSGTSGTMSNTLWQSVEIESTQTTGDVHTDGDGIGTVIYWTSFVIAITFSFVL